MADKLMTGAVYEAAVSFVNISGGPATVDPSEDGPDWSASGVEGVNITPAPGGLSARINGTVNGDAVITVVADADNGPNIQPLTVSANVTFGPDEEMAVGGSMTFTRVDAQGNAINRKPESAFSPRRTQDSHKTK